MQLYWQPLRPLVRQMEDVGGGGIGRPLRRHQFYQKLLGFGVRNGGLDAHAHQAACPIERNPGLSEQRTVNAVAAPVVVGVELSAVVRQELNDFRSPLMRCAVQRGAPFVVGNVRIDAQIETHLHRFQALLPRTIRT